MSIAVGLARNSIDNDVAAYVKNADTEVRSRTGDITISWLMKWLGSHELIGFAIYRILAGLALLGALFRGLL